MAESQQEEFQQTVLEAESFSIVEWKLATKTWNEEQKLIAQFARERPLEERKLQAKELLEHGRGTESSGYYELLAQIWSLSDEALDRAIASFGEVSDEQWSTYNVETLSRMAAIVISTKERLIFLTDEESGFFINAGEGEEIESRTTHFPLEGNTHFVPLAKEVWQSTKSLFADLVQGESFFADSPRDSTEDTPSEEFDTAAYQELEENCWASVITVDGGWIQFLNDDTVAFRRWKKRGVWEFPLATEESVGSMARKAKKDLENLVLALAS